MVKSDSYNKQVKTRHRPRWYVACQRKRCISFSGQIKRLNMTLKTWIQIHPHKEPGSIKELLIQQHPHKQIWRTTTVVLFRNWIPKAEDLNQGTCTYAIQSLSRTFIGKWQENMGKKLNNRSSRRAGLTLDFWSGRKEIYWWMEKNVDLCIDYMSRRDNRNTQAIN